MILLFVWWLALWFGGKWCVAFLVVLLLPACLRGFVVLCVSVYWLVSLL